MGKRYSLWDGNTKIGEIYEHDDPSARSDAKFAQKQLRELEKQIEYSDFLSKMCENHEQRKEKILAEMPGNDRVKYDQSFDELSKEKERLICKVYSLKTKENDTIVIINFLKTILTILLSALCVIDVLKQISKSNYNVFVEIVLIAVFVIFLRYIFGWLKKIAEKFYIWKRSGVINKIKCIAYKIDTLVYSFSTELPPSLEHWGNAYEEKYNLEKYDTIT